MCRLSLRTICLIVAWLHIVFAVFAIAVSLLVIYVYKSGNIPDFEEESEIGIPIFCMYFVLNVARLTIAVMLVKGILQKCRRLLAPFVYGQCMIITFCLGFIVADIWFKLMNRKESIDYSLLDFLLDGVHVGLTILLLYPVYLLYQKMAIDHDQRVGQELSSSASVTIEKCVANNDV